MNLTHRSTRIMSAAALTLRGAVWPIEFTSRRTLAGAVDRRHQTSGPGRFSPADLRTHRPSRRRLSTPGLRCRYGQPEAAGVSSSPDKFIGAQRALPALITAKKSRILLPLCVTSSRGDGPPLRTAQDSNWFCAIHEVSGLMTQSGQAPPAVSQSCPELQRGKTPPENAREPLVLVTPQRHLHARSAIALLQFRRNFCF